MFLPVPFQNGLSKDAVRRDTTLDGQLSLVHSTLFTRVGWPDSSGSPIFRWTNSTIYPAIMQDEVEFCDEKRCNREVSRRSRIDVPGLQPAVERQQHLLACDLAVCLDDIRPDFPCLASHCLGNFGAMLAYDMAVG